MDAAIAIEVAEKRQVARSEAQASEFGASGSDARRVPSEQRRLADCLLRILESERVHAAGLLRGEVVPVVTMARYLIEDAAQRLARGQSEEASEALQNASAQIRDATRQLAALCSELRPMGLDDLGVLAALSWYFRDFSHVNRTIFVSPRLTVAEADVPRDLKLVLFRIVQAALSNVAKHSKASTVRVYLSLDDDTLRLSIEDNGIGFDAERWWHRRLGQEGCGLGMILRWVETSGGRCNIEAIPRRGARVQGLWQINEVPSAAARPAQVEGRLRPAPPTA
jgi:two-component system NarL family sensor kinase